MHARLGLCTLAFGLSLAACGREDVAAPRAPGAPLDDEPTGTALSPGLALSSLLRAAPPGVATGGEFVYVAAVSGTRSDAVRATIANLATGVRVTAAIVEGGFDPVLLPVSEGDSIRVALVDSSGGSTPLVASARRPSPPRVVRTSPRGGRTDVPLNSIVQVVFSAPMDAATIAQQLRLERAGASVPGEVRVLNGGLVAEFAPADALAPGERYELRVGAAARDVLNQSIGTEFLLVFEAASRPDSTVPGSDSSTVQFKRLWVYPSRSNVPGWTFSTGAFWQPRALFAGDSLWLAARADVVQGSGEAVRAQWRSAAASVLRMAGQDDESEALAVAVSPGSAELRANAGSVYGVWRTQVFESMPTSMLTNVWIYVARDGNVFRERVDGSDAQPLIAVSEFQLQRFDWEAYLKYFPGGHDWRLASVSGARTVAANFGGVWIIRSGGDVYAPSSQPEVWCPTWSPDDRHIAFTSQGVPYGETDALMVVDVDSAVTRRPGVARRRACRIARSGTPTGLASSSRARNMSRAPGRILRRWSPTPFRSTARRGLGCSRASSPGRSRATAAPCSSSTRTGTSTAPRPMACCSSASPASRGSLPWRGRQMVR
jgi:hypothetical protein